MKLLNEGPYEMVELKLQDKKNLVEEVFDLDGTGDWDFDIPWHITNDPNLDDIEDGRSRFWENGEEYPFPYAILIGGKTVDCHYDNISRDCAERLGIALSR